VSSKSLEIIISARNNATAALDSAGNAVGGLSTKLSSFDDLADSARGFKSILRNARTVAIAFEVIPVAVDAVKASYATIAGSANDAATGQRALFDGIKEFPIIGKLVAPVAEGISSALAHMFGKESTAELETDVAAQKRVIESFVRDVAQLKADLSTADKANAILGLDPGAVQVVKAKEAFAKMGDEIKQLKQDAVKAASLSPEDIQDQIKGVDKAIAEAQRKSDTKPEELEALQQQRATLQSLAANGIAPQIAQITKLTADAKREEAFAIAEGNQKSLQEETDFSNRLKEEAQQRNNAVVNLIGEGHVKELEADNRGYEAKLEQLKVELAKEADVIKQEADKQRAELDKQANTLQPTADLGGSAGAAAQKKIDEIRQAQADLDASALKQVNAIGANGATDQAKARDDELRQARLDSLQIEARSGSEVAKLALDRLDTSRQLEATEKALQAIANDAKATDQQRADAAKQLLATKQAQQDANSNSLAQSNLEILTKQAALGDTTAAIKLHQLETAKEQATAEAHINDLLANGNLSAKDRLAAQEQLNALKKLGETQQGNDVKDAGLFLLEQQASLGDKVAAQQIKKIELEKQYNEERQKVLAILNSEASAQDKINAKKLLSGLDASEAKAETQLGGNGQKDSQTLATLDTSQYTTGLYASIGQDKDQYQPLLDKQDQHIQVTKDTLNIINQYMVPWFQNQITQTTQELT
jgi:hypothetical protein